MPEAALSRVIDPGTEWEMVRGGDVGDAHGRGGEPVGLRCGCCGRWARFGADVEHAPGCEQAKACVTGPETAVEAGAD